MIQQLVDPAFIRERVEEVRALLKRHSAELENAGAGVRAVAGQLQLSAEELSQAEAELAALTDPAIYVRKGQEAAWMSCHSIQGIIQSALEEFYLKAGAVEEPKGKNLEAGLPAITNLSLKPEWIPTATKGLFRQAEESDVLGWSLSFAVAKAIALLRRKAFFRRQTQPFFPLGNSARLFLFGDWASGIPRAQQVARRLADSLGHHRKEETDCHVIHLGDVYYAGRGFEYEQYLCAPWPVLESEADRVGSWCLNGNHDMFTGGHGYFEFLCKDARFARQNGASYFCLENDHWQIFGLDTAYESEGIKGDAGGLQSPQREFIEERLKAAPGKKAIFLSHHQLFSGYENGSPLLHQRLEGLFSAKNPLTAWFWGHEHRCAVYWPLENVLYPALIGHGGVPVYASSDPKPKLVRYEYQDPFDEGFEKFSRFGFAVLKLEGAAASIDYVNELGQIHATDEVPWVGNPGSP